MGLFDNFVLKRSFHTNQPQLDNIIKEYEAMGFAKAHITKAWQRCKAQQVKFHDELILVTEEENSKLMTQDQLLDSVHRLKTNIHQKEEDLIKQAIQLSLQNDQSDSQEDLGEIYRKDRSKMAGLKNIGNTCYMNVMIQALFGCLPFRNLVFALQCGSETAGQIMIQRLRELFALMLDGNREYMNPSAFFDAMAKFKPSTMLVKGVQNDYYELWVSFLDAIEAGLKEVLPKDHPLMEELRTTFYGRAEENLMYSEGDSEIIKASETTFGVVNIDSKDGELYKAFRNCQSLTIDEYLPDGGQPTQAKIEVKLMEPPKVLSFYINRLTYDLKTKRATKNNGVFQFDEKIQLDQFYKNPEATTKHNKHVQERLEKLTQDEIDCLDSLKQCGDCDSTQSNQVFDGTIELLRQSEDSLQRTLSIDDFVFFDKESQVNSDMLLPSELIKQLERYKQMYAKRREVLSDKLAAIQKEKKQLMEEKQNLYCLTSVIIHEGTADSGHYTCFVLDSSKRWIKCNDRTTTLTTFDEVYKVATGKLGQQRNVSGLVYQEQSWMERAQQEKLTTDLGAFIEVQNASLLRLIDEQTFKRFKGCLQSRMNYLRKQNEALLQSPKADELIRVLQVLKMLDTFMSQQSTILYNYHLMKQAIKIESSDIKAKLHLPQNFESYERAFLVSEFPSGKNSHPLENENNYKELVRLYSTLATNLNAYTSKVQKVVNVANFEQQLENTARVYSEVNSLATVYSAQTYLQRLTAKLRNIFQAMLLKGCFLADLLTQKEDTKVFNLVELISKTTEESTGLGKALKEQVSANLTATLERFQSTKLNGHSFIKNLEGRIKNLALQSKIQIPELAQSAQPAQKEFIDADVLGQILMPLQVNDLKTWIEFVMQIERTGKVIAQSVRLNTEEPLYFSEQ